MGYPLVESLGIGPEREDNIREYDYLVITPLMISHQELMRWAWHNRSCDRKHNPLVTWHARNLLGFITYSSCKVDITCNSKHTHEYTCTHTQCITLTFFFLVVIFRYSL